MSYYKRHMFMCINQRADGVCCQQHEAEQLRADIKQYTKQRGLWGQGKVRINSAGCLDRCDEGPVVVVYPEEVWYQYDNIEDLKEIVDKHLENGEIVERLRI
mgnify:FL=1